MKLTPEDQRIVDNAAATAAQQALIRLRKSRQAQTDEDPFGLGGTEATFILDCSGSMEAGMDGQYGYGYTSSSKLAYLKELMGGIAKEVAINCICFGLVPAGSRKADDETLVIMDTDGGGQYQSERYGAWRTAEIPALPGGSTPLHAALQLALNNDWRDVTVISDGLPNDTDLALKVANSFDRIDAWFLGDGQLHDVQVGRKFMKMLHRGAGTFGSTNLGSPEVRRRLTNKVVGYLQGYGSGG